MCVCRQLCGVNVLQTVSVVWLVARVWAPEMRTLIPTKPVRATRNDFVFVRRAADARLCSVRHAPAASLARRAVQANEDGPRAVALAGRSVSLKGVDGTVVRESAMYVLAFRRKGKLERFPLPPRLVNALESPNDNHRVGTFFSSFFLFLNLAGG